MKKGSKFILGVCLAVGLTTAFSGCVSMNKKFMASGTPAKDHAVIYVDESDFVGFISVDKAPVLFFPKNKSQNVLVPPGNRTIYLQGLAQYGYEPFNPLPKDSELIKVTVPAQWMDNYGAPSSTGLLNFTFNFEAGHYYRLYRPYGRGAGDTNRFILVDETDPSSTWGEYQAQKTEKRIAKTKAKIK